MQRRKRTNWPLVTIGLLTVALFGGYVFLWPVAAHCSRPLPADMDVVVLRPAPLSSEIRYRLFEFVLGAWFFMLGACIGSFLNVVIYRLPRGASLLGGSQCPHCRAKIRPFDNIPVLAWLNLRGRCRVCHLPISPRYALVEFGVGTMFLVLAVLELFFHGVNLPVHSGGGHGYISFLVGHATATQAAIFAYHATLLAIVFSWAMIRTDGFPLPKRYVGLALAIGLVVPALLPGTQPVAWTTSPPGWVSERAWIERGDTSLMGLMAGAFIGLLVSCVQVVARRWAGRNRDGRPSAQPTPEGDWSEPPVGRAGLAGDSSLDRAAVFATVGLYLGWQAAVAIGAMALLMRLFAAVGSRIAASSNRHTCFVYVFAATAIHICFWRALDRLVR